jgi:hypothetical protein
MVKVMALSSDGLSFADGEGRMVLVYQSKGFRLDIIQKNSFNGRFDCLSRDAFCPHITFGDAILHRPPFAKKRRSHRLVKQGMG